MSDIDRCAEVPLVELMRSIPLDKVLRWEEHDGLLISRSAPVGRYLHRAADEIEALQRKCELLQAFRDVCNAEFAENDALPPVAVETPAEWLKGYADATADEMPLGVDEPSATPGRQPDTDDTPH